MVIASSVFFISHFSFCRSLTLDGTTKNTCQTLVHILNLYRKRCSKLAHKLSDDLTSRYGITTIFGEAHQRWCLTGTVRHAAQPWLQQLKSSSSSTAESCTFYHRVSSERLSRSRIQPEFHSWSPCLWEHFSRTSQLVRDEAQLSWFRRYLRFSQRLHSWKKKQSIQNKSFHKIALFHSFKHFR